MAAGIAGAAGMGLEHEARRLLLIAAVLAVNGHGISRRFSRVCLLVALLAPALYVAESCLRLSMPPAKLVYAPLVLTYGFFAAPATAALVGLPFVLFRRIGPRHARPIGDRVSASGADDPSQTVRKQKTSGSRVRPLALRSLHAFSRVAVGLMAVAWLTLYVWAGSRLRGFHTAEPAAAFAGLKGCLARGDRAGVRRLCMGEDPAAQIKVLSDKYGGGPALARVMDDHRTEQYVHTPFVVGFIVPVPEPSPQSSPLSDRESEESGQSENAANSAAPRKPASDVGEPERLVLLFQWVGGRWLLWRVS